MKSDQKLLFQYQNLHSFSQNLQPRFHLPLPQNSQIVYLSLQIS